MGAQGALDKTNLIACQSMYRIKQTIIVGGKSKSGPRRYGSTTSAYDEWSDGNTHQSTFPTRDQPRVSVGMSEDQRCHVELHSKSGQV
jgi:hypothetical protein